MGRQSIGVFSLLVWGVLIVLDAIGVDAVTCSGMFSFEASERSVFDASEDATTLTVAAAATVEQGLAGVEVALAFALLAAAFFCFFIACLLFWNHICTAFSDMLQRSANSCLFFLSGAEQMSNSACKIFSSCVEVLLLLRRAKGALSILGSFVGNVSCEWVMKAKARFLSLAEGVIIALAADNGVSMSVLLEECPKGFFFTTGVEGGALSEAGAEMGCVASGNEWALTRGTQASALAVGTLETVCLMALSTDLGLAIPALRGGSLMMPRLSL